MRWGIGIAAAAVALAAPAAAGAAELRLGMSFKYLTNAPEVTEPLTASAPVARRRLAQPAVADRAAQLPGDPAR